MCDLTILVSADLKAFSSLKSISNTNVSFSSFHDPRTVLLGEILNIHTYVTQHVMH